jgi:hypothetical protein
MHLNLAANAGNLDSVKFLVEVSEVPWWRGGIEAAAISGNLKILEYFNSKGFPPGYEITQCQADFEILKVLVQSGVSIPVPVLIPSAIISRSRSMEYLEWISGLPNFKFANSEKDNFKTMIWAFMSGNLEIIDWCLRSGGILTPDLFSCTKNLESVKILHNSGIPPPEGGMHSIISKFPKNNIFDTLDWLLRNGYTWQPKLYASIPRDCQIWAIQNGYPVTENILNLLPRNGIADPEIFEFAKQTMEWKPTRDMAIVAASQGHFEVVKWMVFRGREENGGRREERGGRGEEERGENGGRGRREEGEGRRREEG